MILLGECCFIFTQPRPRSLRHHSNSHSRTRIKTLKCLRSCELIDFHQQLIPYEVAWSLQKGIVKQKKSQIQNEGDCKDTLIVLQHPSVFTWVLLVPTTTSISTLKSHPFIFIVLNVAEKLRIMVLTRLISLFSSLFLQSVVVLFLFLFFLFGIL